MANQIAPENANSSLTNANDVFFQFCGSETFYRHSFSPIRFTEGVKALADHCSSYWLIDAIVSHQCDQDISIESFQVWELKRQHGDVFTLFATDGNGKELVRQEIEFSDFPYDIATIWLTDKCLLLPSEY